ncbi:unnamed protein product [Vitrella brassicaformis CCMP3155]|uniref:Uncharacterized protein n=1 Tax=Vitrella brassicaformis (strain CCMP3155) TaxID=1169540 RepID=A0A0G4G5X6_VITBC|nr:unnamed protein product [Vitrella brassicaformis CCMP3155]|eukprot:CEM23802.1 unnamed protein product [Vitrella brassicaformis CCMP3155]
MKFHADFRAPNQAASTAAASLAESKKIMKCFAVASLLLIAAAYGDETAAFVPTAPLRTPAASRQPALRARQTPQMAVEDLVGVSVEIPFVFDPLNLGKEQNLYKYRAIELKHGRLAMLAALGYIIQQTPLRLPDPLFLSEDLPLKQVVKVWQERPEALLQILAAVVAIELGPGRQSLENAPGDLGFGARFIPEDEEDYEKLQLKELKNGRLAMIAITGMIVQELLFGTNLLKEKVGESLL